MLFLLTSHIISCTDIRALTHQNAPKHLIYSIVSRIAVRLRTADSELAKAKIMPGNVRLECAKNHTFSLINDLITFSHHMMFF